MIFQESALAHTLLDGRRGIEIGGAAHNPFGLQTWNVNRYLDGMFHEDEIQMCGSFLKVDVCADGTALPFKSGSLDCVISSHVLEHIYDPIAAIEEWARVVKIGGIIFMIVPHKDRTFDKDRPRTPLAELQERHSSGIQNFDHRHWSVWITGDLVEVVGTMPGLKILHVQDADDKVGNGFTVAAEKISL